MVKLLLLGPADVHRNSGQSADAVLAQPKRLALLAYLACAGRGAFHNRTDLLPLFWADVPPDRARNALSQALSFLRAELGGDILVLRGKTGIAINRERLWCDVVAIDPLLDPERMRALRRGSFMDGFSIPSVALVHRWVQTERDRIDDLFEGVVATLPSPLARSARPSPVVHSADRADLVGRHRELRAIEKLLGRAVPVITLHGRGGVGKTRLAEEVVERHAAGLEHGAAIVSLALLDESASIESAIAQRVGCQVASSDVVGDRLLDYLRDKQMLLVLDNAEHLPGVAAVVSAISAASPRLRVLVTSRRVLNLRAEHLVPLDGLEVPPDGYTGDLDMFGATRLFRDVAERSGYPLRNVPEEARAIIAICRAVSGLPLGIEMTASWLRALGPEEILATIARDIDALGVAAGDAPVRHQSFRALLDSSWRLLDEEQRIIAARISVLRSDTDMRAAIRVGHGDPRAILALVDQALLYRTEGQRIGMHDLVRQFLSSKLELWPADLEDAHLRHRHHFADLFAHRDHAFHGPSVVRAVTLMTSCIADVRAAWLSAAASGDVESLARLLEPICEYHEIRSLFHDCIELLGTALHRVRGLMHDGAIDDERGDWIADRIEARLALFEHRIGDHASSRARLDQLLTNAIDRDDNVEAAYCSIKLGMAIQRLGEAERADVLFRAGFQRYAGTDDHAGTAQAVGCIGGVLYETGDVIGAEMYFRRALALWESIGDERGAGFAVSNLAVVASISHKHDEARSLFMRAAACFRELRDWRMVATVLTNWARQCIERDDPAAAEPLLDEARRLVDQQGLEHMRGHVLLNMASCSFALGKFDNAEVQVREHLRVSSNPDSEWLTTALLIVARLHVARGRAELAAEVAGYVATHLAPHHDDANDLAWVLSRVRGELAAHTIEQAIERGAGRPVTAFAAELG